MSSEIYIKDKDTAELLFNKTINDVKRRFYNYAHLADQEEKIRAKLKKQSEPEINMPENGELRVKKECVIDPEAETGRAIRRVERTAKRKQRRQD